MLLQEVAGIGEVTGGTEIWIEFGKDYVEYPTDLSWFLRENKRIENSGGHWVSIDDCSKQISVEREKKGLFQRVFEHAADAIVILDQQQRIFVANEEVERLFGYEREEIIGHGIRVLFGDDSWRDKARDMGRNGSARHRIKTHHVNAIQKNRREFPAEVRCTELKTKYGTYTVAAIRDVSDQEVREKALREVAGRLLHAQEEERRRLSRDLHDSAGQYIALLKMELDLLKSDRHMLSQEITAKIDKCISTAEELTRHIQTVSYLLYPPMLEESGLKSVVPAYIAGFAARSGIRTTYTISPDFGRLPREIEVAIFRVLQEGLTNVHRHSGSHTAQVELVQAQNTVSLTIKDEGRGNFSLETEELGRNGPAVLGVGLRGMRERIEQLGGALALTSGDKGTMVKATVPVGGDPSAIDDESGALSSDSVFERTQSNQAERNGRNGQPKPSATLTGSVEKVIRPPDPSEPEKVQIAVEEADHPYRELRVENSLRDKNGQRVKLKPGAAVDVTIEAEPRETVPPSEH